MNAIIVSAEVVLPLLILMTVGVIVRKTGLIEEETLSKANKLVFYIGLPCLCTKCLYESDLKSITDAGFPLFIAGGIFIFFLIAAFLVPKFIKDPPKRGVLIQAFSRTNDAIFGLTIAASLLPSNQMTAEIIALSISAPLFNILGVIAMEVSRGEKPDIKYILRKIVTNPIIIGCVIGIIIVLAEIKIPDILYSPICTLSNMVTPVAFIIIGSRIHFSAIKKDKVWIILVSLFRLFLIPGIMVAAAILLKFPSPAVIATMCTFGSPVGTSTYSLSCELGGDDQLASELIAVTHALAIISMFILIVILKSYGGISI